MNDDDFDYKSGPVIGQLSCKPCGLVVADKEAHIDWHARIEGGSHE